jgi:hypothetical protein
VPAWRWLCKNVLQSSFQKKSSSSSSSSSRPSYFHISFLIHPSRRLLWEL